MAIDSRDKRFSMVGLFQPVPSLLPNPDGAIGTQDRAFFLFLYFGLALEAVSDVSNAHISRYIFIESENRVLAIESDDRVVMIESENRADILQ